MKGQVALSWLILFSWQILLANTFYHEEKDHRNCFCRLSQSFCHHPLNKKDQGKEIKKSFFCSCPTKIWQKSELPTLFLGEKPNFAIITFVQLSQVSLAWFHKNPEFLKFYPPS